MTPRVSIERVLLLDVLAILAHLQDAPSRWYETMREADRVRDQLQLAIADADDASAGDVP